MRVRPFLFLGGLMLLGPTLSAAPVFTADSRTDEARATSAIGGENEDKSDTLTDFSPGVQSHDINYIHAPTYSAVVTATATTAYTDTTYSFSTYDDSNTNIATASAASLARAQFESLSYFHLDQSTLTEISGTANQSIPVNEGTLGADTNIILQITDTSTFNNKLFVILGNGTFDYTRTLPAGDYYFRFQALADTSSTVTNAGISRATVNVTGTFAIPEPTELTLLAGALPLLLRRRPRR